MPEGSSNSYKSPAFSLQLEKSENLSFLAQTLCEVSLTNPRVNRVNHPIEKLLNSMTLQESGSSRA